MIREFPSIAWPHAGAQFFFYFKSSGSSLPLLLFDKPRASSSTRCPAGLMVPHLRMAHLPGNPAHAGVGAAAVRRRHTWSRRLSAGSSQSLQSLYHCWFCCCSRLSIPPKVILRNWRWVSDVVGFDLVVFDHIAPRLETQKPVLPSQMPKKAATCMGRQHPRPDWPLNLRCLPLTPIHYRHSGV